jgi:hypothetical protein
VSQEYRFQLVDEERRFEARSSERFDRIEFALRVLDVLRPNMNITVYESRRKLQIRRGRDWAHGPDATWALIAIPPDASRRHVVSALAELAGVAHLPFVVDLLNAAHPATAPV